MRLAELHFFGVVFCTSLSLCMFSLAESSYSQVAANDTTGSTIPVKTMVASRVNAEPPVIDGRLDDSCWGTARVYSDFVQEDPVEGAEPTEKTEVRVIYDNKALYVGVRAFDSEPGKIAGQLTRKDDALGLSSDDLVIVSMDCYHDHQNGYSFYVNPRGSRMDNSWYKDTQVDMNWEGVWEVATSVDTLGWNAEFRIPFSILRFIGTKNLTWGFNVSRTIARKKEGDEWQFRRRADTGMVSLLGHLELPDIRVRPQLELYPFCVGRSQLEPKNALTNPDGREWSSSAGLDAKYDIRPNIVLNATVNPDFGQVEADPSILNLSAYETFYPEKRPFFLEGTGVFDTPIQLFYSRRIGRRPSTFSVLPTDLIIDYPEATTIPFAGKVTGKTEGGTGLGFVEAVTDEEVALVDSMGVRKERLVEPLTNYLLARVSRDVGQSNSNVGVLLTAVNRRSGESAHTGGVDWKLNSKGKAYCFSGQVAGSDVGTDDGRKQGYGAKIYLGKDAGKYFRANLTSIAYSPEFEINDLGYLSRNDQISVKPLVLLQRQQEPWWIVRSVASTITNQLAWNYDGINLAKNVQLSNSVTFLNYYIAIIGLNHSFPSFDDRATRGGPLLRTLASTSASCLLMTDMQKPIWGSASAYLSWFESSSRGRSYYLSLSYRPSSSLMLSFSGSYTSSFSDAQWLMNLDSNADGSYDHFVFGELMGKSLSLTARADAAFTPNLSLQVYVEPYIAVGDFANTKELARPASYEFKPFDLGFEPDYNVKALRSNVVLRWEYRPGSTLFLVWTQSRDDNSNPGDFSLGRDLRSLFGAPGTNIFLAKVSYRFTL